MLLRCTNQALTGGGLRGSWAGGLAMQGRYGGWGPVPRPHRPCLRPAGRSWRGRSTRSCSLRRARRRSWPSSSPSSVSGGVLSRGAWAAARSLSSSVPLSLSPSQSGARTSATGCTARSQGCWSPRRWRAPTSTCRRELPATRAVGREVLGLSASLPPADRLDPGLSPGPALHCGQGAVCGG